MNGIARYVCAVCEASPPPNNHHTTLTTLLVPAVLPQDIVAATPCYDTTNVERRNSIRQSLYVLAADGVSGTRAQQLVQGSQVTSTSVAHIVLR